VAATADPNPQVSGRGISRLRAVGVEVLVGACEREARELNDGFARFIQTGTPMVTLKAALSVDGMLAPPASTLAAKQTYWLTGPEARAEVQRLRHAADALLTGIGTVLADNPLLTDRTGLARRRKLLRVLLDSQLRIPLDSQLVRSASEDVLVLCGPDAAPKQFAALQAAGVEVERIASESGRLDLAAALDVLGKRKVLGLLLECGSELNGAFLAQGFVDKAMLFYAPAELGANAVPFAAGVGSPFLLEQTLKSVSRRTFGVDACISGYLRDPWE